MTVDVDATAKAISLACTSKKATAPLADKVRLVREYWSITSRAAQQGEASAAAAGAKRT